MRMLFIFWVDPIAHWDIKLENILRDNNVNFKLCDFGSCVVGKQPCVTKAEGFALRSKS